MNTSLKKAISLTAESLKMPSEKVSKIYRAYWWSIRDLIQQMHLKGKVTEKDLNGKKLSFNIPSLGKLYTSHDRIDGVKRRFEYLRKIRKNDSNKETETDV